MNKWLVRLNCRMSYYLGIFLLSRLLLFVECCVPSPLQSRFDAPLRPRDQTPIRYGPSPKECDTASAWAWMQVQEAKSNTTAARGQYMFIGSEHTRKRAACWLPSPSPETSSNYELIDPQVRPKKKDSVRCRNWSSAATSGAAASRHPFGIVLSCLSMPSCHRIFVHSQESPDAGSRGHPRSASPARRMFRLPGCEGETLRSVAPSAHPNTRGRWRLSVAKPHSKMATSACTTSNTTHP
jgi:hypothetical protein